MAWDTEGAGEFPYSETAVEWNASGFVAAVEAENEPAAIAHIRGALAQRLRYEPLRAAIGEAALAHYAAFGHCAIYTLKAGQLIGRLGQQVAEQIQDLLRDQCLLKAVEIRYDVSGENEIDFVIRNKRCVRILSLEE
jgi:hypothetical protein